MARPSSYPKELRERAVPLVAESKGDFDGAALAGKDIRLIASACMPLNVLNSADPDV